MIMRGDINATELYQDREFLTRLGYGMLDVPVGSTGGVGFEDVRLYSHVDNEEEDVKAYRRRVFNLIGRYYTNELSKILWQKFLDHKWVLSEQIGREINLKDAAEDWMEKYSHDFFKAWTLQQLEVPYRLRGESEPRLGFLELLACRSIPQWRELIEVGVSLSRLTMASLLEALRGRKYHYLRLVARLTRHRIKDMTEAERRQAEISQLEQNLSQQSGESYGTRAATIEYYRRLNLVAEFEGKSSTEQTFGLV